MGAEHFASLAGLPVRENDCAAAIACPYRAWPRTFSSASTPGDLGATEAFAFWAMVLMRRRSVNADTASGIVISILDRHLISGRRANPSCSTAMLPPAMLHSSWPGSAASYSHPLVEGHPKSEVPPWSCEAPSKYEIFGGELKP